MVLVVQLERTPGADHQHLHAIAARRQPGDGDGALRPIGKTQQKMGMVVAGDGALAPRMGIDPVEDARL